MPLPTSARSAPRPALASQGPWVLGLLLVFLVFREAAETRMLLANQPLGYDLLPLWTAGRLALRHPDQLYSFDILTHLQQWAIGIHTGPRPWIYPPSALLVFAPVAWAPFRIFYPAFTGAAAALFGWAVLVQLRRDRRLSLAILALSTSVFLALLVGQVVLLVGALIVWGVALLGRRPVLAGVLLGAAAMIKPTSLLLLPVALLAARNWRALAACALTCAGLAALSAALFGWRTWIDWLAALPAFDAVIRQDPTIWRGVVNFTWLAHLAGAPEPLVLAIRIGLAGLGAILVWKLFRATERPAPRTIAMVGASLLITPYAMFYDAALLTAPALVLAAEDERRIGPGLACLLLAEVAGSPPASPIGLIALLAFATALVLRPDRTSAAVAAPA